LAFAHLPGAMRLPSRKGLDQQSNQIKARFNF
jgi:hypothetical protein